MDSDTSISTDSRCDDENVDVLLDKNREMDTDLILTKATVVILFEPTYMSGLDIKCLVVHDHMEKRKVSRSTLKTGTMIENMMIDIVAVFVANSFDITDQHINLEQII